MATSANGKPPPPLRNTLISGSAWMIGLQWCLRLLGAVNVAILARLLTPEDFGLVAMATAIVALSKVFFELGVDYALIRKIDAKDSHFHAAWSIRLLQSIALAGTLILAAPLAAEYYEDTRITPILGVIAIGVLLQGLTNIGVISFRKELQFSCEFQYLVLSKLLSIGATIVLAFSLRSYWALVIGIVLANGIQCLLSYVLHSFRPKLSFTDAGDIWSFSKWMIALQISNYLTLRFDRLLLGGLTTPSQLGHYTIGVELSQMTTTELVAPASRALVPGLAKLQSDPNRLRKAFLKTVAATALLTLPTAIGLSLTAEKVVPIALGDQWTPAIAIVQIACLHLMLSSLVSGASNLSLVTGHIVTLVKFSILRSAIFLTLFYWAFDAFQILGILYLKTGIEFIWVLALFGIVSKTQSIPLDKILKQLIRPTIACAVMSLGLINLEAHLSSSMWLALGTTILAGGALYTATIFVLWRVFGSNDDVEFELLNLVAKKLFLTTPK